MDISELLNTIVKSGILISFDGNIAFTSKVKPIFAKRFERVGVDIRDINNIQQLQEAFKLSNYFF